MFNKIAAYIYFIYSCDIQNALLIEKYMCLHAIKIPFKYDSNPIYISCEKMSDVIVQKILLKL